MAWEGEGGDKAGVADATVVDKIGTAVATDIGDAVNNEREKDEANAVTGVFSKLDEREDPLVEGNGVLNKGRFTGTPDGLRSEGLRADARRCSLSAGVFNNEEDEAPGTGEELGEEAGEAEEKEESTSAAAANEANAASLLVGPFANEPSPAADNEATEAAEEGTARNGAISDAEATEEELAKACPRETAEPGWRGGKMTG